MINNKKLIAFVIITLLFLVTLTLPNVSYIILIPMYVIFVLIGLYDLGVDEEEREKQERQSK
jgi:hypothetical protein